MEKKIVTSIGGLGNQMFCYAFYKKLCMEYPQITFCMDISDVWDKRFGRGAEFLRVFPNIQIREATAREIFDVEGKVTFRYRGKGSRLIRKVVDVINRKTMQKKKFFCVTEEMFERQKCIIAENEWNRVKYFNGFWQNIEYYIPYLSDLQKDFEFAPLEDEKNRKLYKQIQETNSVSVHVRRGDYVGEILDILDTGYYTEIIKQIIEKEPESIFYFFSNDAEYVKKEYEWLKNKIIVEHNTGLNSFRDMQLMSACKKNIIANSTFSIWAGILNQNQDRKVYYPSHYCEGIEMQTISLPGFEKYTVRNQIKE